MKTFFAALLLCACAASAAAQDAHHGQQHKQETTAAESSDRILRGEAIGAETHRVTFDHKFAVPKDSSKMNFRAEGTLKLKTLSKETVEHLVKDDGAKIKTNPDGTANEVTFLATGV